MTGGPGVRTWIMSFVGGREVCRMDEPSASNLVDVIRVRIRWRADGEGEVEVGRDEFAFDRRTIVGFGERVGFERYAAFLVEG